MLVPLSSRRFGVGDGFRALGFDSARNWKPQSGGQTLVERRTMSHACSRSNVDWSKRESSLNPTKLEYYWDRFQGNSFPLIFQYIVGIWAFTWCCGHLFSWPDQLSGFRVRQISHLDGPERLSGRSSTRSCQTLPTSCPDVFRRFDRGMVGLDKPTTTGGSSELLGWCLHRQGASVGRQRQVHVKL